MAKATPIPGLSASAPLREAGARILTARLGDVGRHEPGLPTQGPVHDMRVAARRLRAALRLLGLRELDPEVKRLQDALGRVRDLQLQKAWLAGRDDRLAARRQRLLRKAEAALGDALSRWRSRAVPLFLQAAQGKFKGKLGGGRVRKLLRKRVKRFEQRLRAALRRPSPGAMHAVRRSAKQLRYLFELAGPAFPALSRSMLAELSALQTALGELHDIDVRITLLGRGPLAREQTEDRARLAAIVGADLARWQEQKVAQRTRTRLRR